MPSMTIGRRSLAPVARAPWLRWWLWDNSMPMSTARSAEQLAVLLRNRLLSAPPSRVTRDVEAWAAGQGFADKPPDLLDRYRQAYEEARASLVDDLRQDAVNPVGRAAVIALLNRPGVADAERLVALDALDGLISRDDVTQVASTLVKQRTGVAHRAAEVLAGVPSGESLFVLNKVLGRRADAAGRVARELGQRIDGSSATAGDTREAVFFALARSPESQLDSAATSTAREIDRELQESGRTAQGLSDYQQVLRDELHLLAVLSNVPTGDELGDRARKTLFTLIPLERVRELAPQLSGEVVAQYCQRSLSRTQRRRARDRAQLALELLAAGPEEVRRACSAELHECLTEDSVELQYGAAKALARDAETLTDQDRSAIGEVYAELPPKWQARLAPALRGVLSDDVVLDIAALNRWLLGAGPNEVSDRLETGLARWAKSETIDATGVAEIASTLITLADQLPSEERQRARCRIAENVASWLAASRSQPRPAIEALLEGRGIPDLISEQFWQTSLQAVPAAVVRVLVPACVISTSAPEDALARLATEAPRDHAPFRSALRELIEAPRDLDRVFGLAGSTGRAELLLARLGLIRQLAADERRLILARDEATTEALIASRQAVLRALDAAEDASSGNEHLQRQFGAIRRAIGLVTESGEGRAPEQSVIEWRQQTIERLGDALVAADPATPLTVRDTATGALTDLLRLIEELDRRAHARGVTAATDRAHHAADLDSVIRGVLALQGNTVPPELAQLAARRPELARLVWSLALGETDDAMAALVAALADQTDRRRALLQTDILLERLSETDLIEVMERLSAEQVAVAWPLTGQLYAHRRRARDAVAADVERQSEQVMENIAAELDLPFRAIESILFGYFRLRAILRDAGWGQIARSLGDLIPREELNLERYEVADAEPSDDYVVRSLGISVHDRAVRRAIVEPVRPVEPTR